LGENDPKGLQKPFGDSIEEEAGRGNFRWLPHLGAAVVSLFFWAHRGRGAGVLVGLKARQEKYMFHVHVYIFIYLYIYLNIFIYLYIYLNGLFFVHSSVFNHSFTLQKKSTHPKETNNDDL
jgi:hypothetical protein